MSEDLIAKWLDDRSSLSDDEAAELHRVLSTDAALARQVKDQLATDELVSRKLAVDRRNFENQVAQRIIGAGSDKSFLKSTLEAVRGKESRRFSWRARLPEAAAAVVLIAGLFLLLRREAPIAGPTPAAASVKRGLRAQYYKGQALQGVAVDRIDATLDYSWRAGEPPIAATKDVYSVRWTGKLTPKFTERTTLLLRYDDGVRLWIDNKVVHDDWAGRYVIAAKKVAVDLSAGRPVDLKIEYFNGGDRGVMRMSWSSRSLSEEVIPETALSHE